MTERDELIAALTKALDNWERWSFQSKMIGGKGESANKAEIDAIRRRFGIGGRCY